MKGIGATGLCAALALGAFAMTGDARSAADKPNILFIIMDDVGIDQMQAFGYGGPDPAKMPNVQKLMDGGVAFTNVWSMPECSPSRAAYFTGRYPQRTGVVAAIVDNHLPQDYLSSFETTLPRILTNAGYTNSMVGKYHLGNDQDPAGDCAPRTRGWDNFQGNMTAGPPSIDLTAGGTDPSASSVCGYDQSSDAGACYRQNSTTTRCTYIDASNALPATTPARTCLQQGGIFTANQACGAAPPDSAAWDNYNAYYVWPRTAFNGAAAPTRTYESSCGAPTTSRRYMTTAQSDDASSWWNRTTGPRMLTLSFNSMHTPFQKAPTTLVPDPRNRQSTCNSGAPQRFLLNSMLEGMDVEIGRALGRMGLATLASDGKTIERLTLGNTMVVVVGDNGSYGTTVRVTDGFNAGRAKASVYQTGVWVPLIIAGPMVNSPGRSVDSLVNIVDLFNLFGAVAGVNVDEVVPPSRVLDAKPMLAYLAGTNTPPIRKTSFTQTGAGTFTPVESERSWPCLIASSCNDTQVNTESLCSDNGGTWYGPGAAVQQTSCCAVIASVSGATIIPPAQFATRNKVYKLVETDNTDCSKPLAPGQKGAFPWAEYQTTKSFEFYDISLTPSNPVGMDNSDDNMLANCPSGTNPGDCLPAEAKRSWDQLRVELQGVKTSNDPQAKCARRGDGNLDLFVNAQDIADFEQFRGKGPSRYDINLDGETDGADLRIIRASQGLDCMDICERADLNRDGKINDRDMLILTSQTGNCAGSKQVMCGGDLNGDSRVNNIDAELLNSARATCNAPRGRSAAAQ